MQKQLSIFMLCLYLLASVGLTVSAHYCGGNLASLAFFEKNSCCCETESQSGEVENKFASRFEGEKDDCCKNEIKPFRIGVDQLKEDQHTAKTILSAWEFLPSLAYIFRSCPIEESSIAKTLPLPDPPETNSLPSYKRNHSFLFYS